ncbi:hypothetical protein HHK36_029160 [Tetracentron sinense]|uniref:Acid phosphatase/vanadium-dependent haloperoxidase-related protein n=1 Tax=Tetracentron sinense TaxID=13715 RepID=A0A834YGC2_TETSI|nr:hypothetical protein HHK36_029160 [Tetracentron sinense]
MDSISIKPSSIVSIYKPIIHRIKLLNKNPFSFLEFNHCKKLGSSTISVSCRTPSNPESLKNKCNYSIPINPFWVVVPVLQSIGDFAASGTRKGSFLLRNSVEKWGSCLRGFGELERVSDGLEEDYLQSGGIGMALLSVTSTAKVRISPFVATLVANPTFVSSMVAWVVAQSMKLFFNFFMERKWDFRIMFASGGMPSSHSALCTALTTSVALCHGVADSLFPVCLGFSLIVMYDAIGVRRHAGMQAENSIIIVIVVALAVAIIHSQDGASCFKLVALSIITHRSLGIPKLSHEASGHVVIVELKSGELSTYDVAMRVLNMILEDLFQGHPISQRKLKELLGHTPSQVLAGALLGILIACICCQGCVVGI